jgi:hypothetical protein
LHYRSVSIEMKFVYNPGPSPVWGMREEVYTEFFVSG